MVSPGVRSRGSRADAPKATSTALPKCPTGIHGLDEITLGGLPRGRSTLVCGGPGCGKTLLGMEFLVRGAINFNEPGVCLSFEETAEELASNVASLGFDVGRLIARKQLAIDHVYLERGLMEEAGEYDLEALFLRLGFAVDSIGARRVLIDSVETLFSALKDKTLLRSELSRLFRWLKDRSLTAIVTAERGDGVLTRHGLEEYISDCVILLDHRVTETVLTRRLRIVKYRGTTHGTNEYPFLIESDGISVLPLTSAELQHAASLERVPTGVPALDTMFGGKGYFRASSILVSGTSGSGKTSLTAHFVDAACSRGEKCIFLSFEESANQIIRNMRSIGIDLGGWVDKGLLYFQAARPTTFGLEMHLVKIHRMVKEIIPRIVIVDPINGLLQSGSASETRSMVLRLVDFLKEQQITSMLTTLTSNSGSQEQTEIEMSSLVDTWLLLRDIESGGERNRGLYVIKGRGVAHSNQIREFLLTDHGVDLRDVYLGEEGLLTGSARVMREAKDASTALSTEQEAQRTQLFVERKRRVLDAQIAALQLERDTEAGETLQLLAQSELRRIKGKQDLRDMSKSRFIRTALPETTATTAKIRTGGK